MIIRWKESDHLLQLLGLRNKKTQVAINNATIRATVLDSTGAAVVAFTDVQLPNVPASNGDYEVAMPDTLDLPEAGAPYECKMVIIQASGDKETTWEKVDVVKRSVSTQ